MATAKECDRCEALYKDAFYVPNITISVYYPTTGSHDVDLCPKCREDLMVFLKMRVGVDNGPT